MSEILLAQEEEMCVNSWDDSLWIKASIERTSFEIAREHVKSVGEPIVKKFDPYAFRIDMVTSETPLELHTLLATTELPDTIYGKAILSEVEFDDCILVTLYVVTKHIQEGHKTPCLQAYERLRMVTDDWKWIYRVSAGRLGDV